MFRVSIQYYVLSFATCVLSLPFSAAAPCLLRLLCLFSLTCLPKLFD